MVGAVLGFLPYNLPPASIFMGDAGSMLLGFFVAAMLALFTQESTARWPLAAVVVFALAILDTALAVVRRLIAGKSIFAGDRSHLYDQLVDRGMSVKGVVGLFYLLATVAAVVGVMGAIFLRVRFAAPIYLVLLIIIWVIFYKAGMLKPQSRTSRGTKE
jgi:UDP-GlcNAc:undecaprenyl-phosphate GlcNAc-1-phosphate transferase